MMSMNLSDTSILKIKNFNYLCIISGTSKSEAMNLLQNNDLSFNLNEKNIENYKLKKI